MVDETGDGSSSGVQYHLLVEVHQIVALSLISLSSLQTIVITNLCILVSLVHPKITLILCYDLTSVLNNDLIGLKCTVASHSVSAVDRLNDFDADVILASILCTLLQSSECTIGTVTGADSAITVIALIEHETIEAFFVAAIFGRAYTCRCLKRLRFLPDRGGFSNKDIWCRLLVGTYSSSERTYSYGSSSTLLASAGMVVEGKIYQRVI